MKQVIIGNHYRLNKKNSCGASLKTNYWGEKDKDVNRRTINNRFANISWGQEAVNMFVEAQNCDYNCLFSRKLHGAPLNHCSVRDVSYLTAGTSHCSPPSPPSPWKVPHVLMRAADHFQPAHSSSNPPHYHAFDSGLWTLQLAEDARCCAPPQCLGVFTTGVYSHPDLMRDQHSVCRPRGVTTQGEQHESKPGTQRGPHLQMVSWKTSVYLIQSAKSGSNSRFMCRQMVNDMNFNKISLCVIALWMFSSLAVN